MDLLEMIFSIVLLLLLGVVIWRKTRPKYLLSFLESGDPKVSSYQESIKVRTRYFPHASGIVDLSKHPDLLLFADVSNPDKRYLVEPWGRSEDVFVQEGKTKAVIFEVLEDQTGALVAIPCLRLIDAVLEKETDNPLEQYKRTVLSVSWDEGKRKMIDPEYFIGIVRYESV